MTLHNCKIYYLAAVNYDPEITDLIFIRVNIYPGPGESGGLTADPVYFIRVTIYPAAVPRNIRRGHYLPRWGGGRRLTANISTYLFYQGHFLPRGFIPQY